MEPALGTPVGGWGARAEHDAVGRHSTLTATALALESHDGCAPVVIVACDVVLWPGAVTARVRAAVAERCGIAPDVVQLAGSHTHASVMMDDPTIESWEHDGLCAAARELVETTVADVAARAVADLQPTRVEAVRVVCPVARSRRQHVDGRLVVGVDQPVDDAFLDVISFTHPDGAPLASVVVYGMHPTVLAWASLVFSPDYVGAIRDVVEDALGGPCLFLQGCGADRAPARSFSNSVADADAVGRAVGHAAAAAMLAHRERTLVATPTGVLESGASLAINTVSPPDALPSAVAHRAAELEMSLRPRDLAAARSRVARARAAVAGGDSASSIELARAVIELDISQRFPDGERASVPADLVSIGDLAIVFWPGELAGAYERLCQDESDRAVLLVTNANDYVNYLPAPHQFAEGGYEVDASPFASQAAREFVDGVVRLVSKGE